MRTRIMSAFLASLMRLRVTDSLVSWLQKPPQLLLPVEGRKACEGIRFCQELTRAAVAANFGDQILVR